MGPFARFYKLDEEKQSRILNTALNEFSEHGFENASLNSIISKSGISKGSFYYYFEDKMDLFVTVLRSFIDFSEFIEKSGLLESVDHDDFWERMRQMVNESLLQTIQNPHLLQIGELFHQLDPKLQEHGQLAEFMQEVGLSVSQLIMRGQSVGAIRRDLPMDLILPLWFSIDSVFTKWALAQEFEMSDPKALEFTNISLDFFYSAFKP